MSGGLFSGANLIAALALGTQGIYMGTRFIASAETRAFCDKYKETVINAKEAYRTDPTLVAWGVFGPCRYYRNPWSLKMSDLVKRGASEEEIWTFEKFSTDDTVAEDAPQYLAARDGDLINGCLYFGQGAVNIDKSHGCQRYY